MVWKVDHKYINNNNSDKYHPILGKKSIKIQTSHKMLQVKGF